MASRHASPDSGKPHHIPTPHPAGNDNPIVVLRSIVIPHGLAVPQTRHHRDPDSRIPSALPHDIRRLRRDSRAPGPRHRRPPARHRRGLVPGNRTRHHYNSVNMKFVQTTYWSCVQWPTTMHCGWHEPILDASNGAGSRGRGREGAQRAVGAGLLAGLVGFFLAAA
ncbi:hypothetical protein PG999_014412 [Apiospora kogelbergensis]|uniref:Uncharacterized protein n=1 Tax=Apiospora kogelbergensis TaxID=1337665 RepID=A0AAW0Q5S7_9PEZI